MPPRRWDLPAALAALAIAACTQAAAPAVSRTKPEVTKSEPAPATDAVASFEATVRIDAEPGSKRFQGVWLELADGERFVIAYRAEPLWRAFENHRVRATGAHYEPPGQAIRARHFAVETLQVLDPAAPPMPRLVEARAEQELSGTFETHTFPKRTKLEGEAVLVFVTDAGRTYHLANPRADAMQPGVAARVTAREVVLSPFMAHVGGPHLWITDVEARR